MREERAGAGDVFFGMDGVDLVFDFVAFVRNGEDAQAMDGRSGRAKVGDGQAEMVPGKINRIGDEENCGEHGREAGDEADARG